MNRKRTILIIGLLVILAGVAAVGRMAGGPRSRTGAQSTLTTTRAARGDLSIRVEATGQVEAIQTIDIKSRIAGEVLAVHASSGDHVAENAVLVEVDPRDVQNAYDQAKADLESATVRAQTTETERARMEELRRTDAVTQREFESAVETASAAKSALVRAETDLELAEENLADVRVRAPIAGTVLERTVEPGIIIASATGNISGGSALLKLADLSEMRVRTLVDETDIGQVAAGQECEVTVEAYSGRVFPGTVEKIEPLAVMEQNVTMFPVLVRMQNPDEALKPGMNAEVVIHVAQRDDAVLIPNAGIVGARDAAEMARLLGLRLDDAERAPDIANTSGPEGASGEPGAVAPANGVGAATVPAAEGATTPGYVFILSANGVEPRTVRAGLSDWNHTEIVSGLDAGEEVVLLTVAQLQAEQEKLAQELKERVGGLVPGGSGPPAGPPPGGGPGGSGGASGTASARSGAGGGSGSARTGGSGAGGSRGR